MSWITTEKPVAGLRKPERESLSAFLTVHSRLMDKETKEIQNENQLLRLKLDAIKAREALKFR